MLFQNNGEVILVGSTRSENGVANWILDQRDQCKSLYVISDSKIEFWVKTESALLKTRFKGTVEDNTLTLKLTDSSSNKEFNYKDIFTFKSVAIKAPNKRLDADGLNTAPADQAPR